MLNSPAPSASVGTATEDTIRVCGRAAEQRENGWGILPCTRIAPHLNRRTVRFLKLGSSCIYLCRISSCPACREDWSALGHFCHSCSLRVTPQKAPFQVLSSGFVDCRRNAGTDNRPWFDTGAERPSLRLGIWLHGASSEASSLRGFWNAKGVYS